MSFKHKAAAAATTAALMGAMMGVAGTAQAAFQGRDATGAASTTCTASGPGKCTYFYDTTLDITILNNWSLGVGSWSAIAAPGSAQALAASAGLSASGLTGWVLPTGDGGAPAGAQNQYLSIFNSAGGGVGISSQFDGVTSGDFWSNTVFAPNAGFAHSFRPVAGFGDPQPLASPFFAVAVRPGDLVAAIPEPQTYALMLMGLGAVLLARRRRTR